MAFNSYTFPHAWIEVQDNSMPEIPPANDAGLHVPMFFIFAERGPVNEPVYGGFEYLKRIFGAKTFDPRSKYYTHQNLYAEMALGFQQVYIVRLADPEASQASLAIFMDVTTKSVIQYQRDLNGQLILGTDGNPLPKLMLDGITPVTENSIELTFSSRALDLTTEAISALPTQNVTVGATTYTRYPLMAFDFSAVGSAGSKYGFRFYYKPDYEQSVVTATESMIYQFEPVYQADDGFNTQVAIRDVFLEASNQVSLKEDAVDATTDTDYFAQNIILDRFIAGVGATRHHTIPYKTHFYSDNVAIVGQRILDVSPELVAANITPFMVNIISGVDQYNTAYDHFKITNATDYFNKSRAVFLIGGDDGDTTLQMFEAQYKLFMSGDLYPDIVDNFRFPITHVYDSGFTLPTKRESVSILSLRDDVAIDFTTQDVSLLPNNKADDQSTGVSLRTRVLLYPESTFFGTPVVRASIYQQCGTLNDRPTYRRPVPASLWRLLKRCQYEAGPQRTGQPKGRTASEVSMFRDLNWYPAGYDHKQLNWETGLNYIQFADRRVLFYPDLRSVYPFDNSVLSDDVFRDTIVYVKHIVRRNWTYFSGLDIPKSQLADRIIKAIDGDIYFAFQGDVRSLTSMDNTEEYKALGWRSRIKVSLFGTVPNRTWDVIIPVYREE